MEDNLKLGQEDQPGLRIVCMKLNVATDSKIVLILEVGDFCALDEGIKYSKYVCSKKFLFFSIKKVL